MLVTRRKDGSVVRQGEKITNFRGEKAEFVRAIRARDGHRTGKIVYKPADGRPGECYDTVYGLTVTAE